MSILIRELTGEARDDWNGYLDRAPHASPFHYREALEELATLSGSTLRLLVGFKGQEPVGCLPLFERSLGGLTIVDSPPEGTEVYYLGAVMIGRDQLKRRKTETRIRRFVTAAVDWLDAELAPDLTTVRTVDRFVDLRAFREQGFQLAPYYTYVVDLTPTPEQLLGQFSRDARSNVHTTDEDAYELVEGNATDAARIIEEVRARHEAQDEPYDLTTDFVRALYRRLPEGVVRPYVCRVDGAFAGGIVALECGDTIFRWQGGTKHDADVPVNDLLDWHLMCEGKARGRTRYDLMGANQYRLTRYKSKFGGKPTTYHRVLRRSRRARLLAKLRSVSWRFREASATGVARLRERFQVSK